MSSSDETLQDMQVALFTASDVAATSFTLWLVALMTQLFGQATATAKGVRAGNAVAGVFMLGAAAAGACVAVRLYQAHYGTKK